MLQLLQLLVANLSEICSFALQAARYLAVPRLPREHVQCRAQLYFVASMTRGGGARIMTSRFLKCRIMRRTKPLYYCVLAKLHMERGWKSDFQRMWVEELPFIGVLHALYDDMCHHYLAVQYLICLLFSFCFSGN